MTFKTMKDLVNTKQNNKLKPEEGVYSIACINCHKKYIGETSSNLNTIWYEYKRDILQNNTSNALVGNCEKTDHNFEIKSATLMKGENNSLWCKMSK